ncbi:MAG: hypothetical protein ACTS2F_03000 [Thainema sp.]
MLKNLFRRPSAQTTSTSADTKKQILFIFGCQRSGTTITSDILGKLNYVKSYAEVNTEITDQDTEEGDLHTIRLNPLDDVKQKIYANSESLVVVKPLVESQYAPKILDYFPDSHAMWMYRDYRDVINSLINRFGARNKVLFRMLEDGGNWRAENLPLELKETLAKYAHEKIAPADAWSLFWYARNYLFFSQSLEQDRRVVLVKYNKLVQQRDYLEQCLNRVDIHAPGLEYVWNYHEKSVGQGREIEVSDSIRTLLDEMLQKLNTVESQQWD